jgi:uncharacterized membrane protein
MAISIFLLGAARRPTAIKRLIRHPQLTGVIVWSAAHLLANGEQRSLLLFAGIGVWATVEILAINRRDGAWVKAAAPSARTEVIGVVVSLLAFGLIAWLHPWFTGVPLLPR